MTARPALDRWLAESADILERTFPSDQCAEGEELLSLPFRPIAPPRPLRVEADAATASHGVAATSRQVISWLWKKGLSI